MDANGTENPKTEIRGPKELRKSEERNVSTAKSLKGEPLILADGR